jgi:hypothetical protein
VSSYAHPIEVSRHGPDERLLELGAEVGERRERLAGLSFIGELGVLGSKPECSRPRHSPPIRRMKLRCRLLNALATRELLLPLGVGKRGSWRPCAGIASFLTNRRSGREDLC